MEFLIGLILPLLGTTIGAAMVFLVRDRISDFANKAMLGFASGIMVAAAFWSLLQPALEQSGNESIAQAWPVIIGFLVGMGFLLALDTCTTAGKTEGKHCSVCNEVIAEQTEIPALGHDEINHEAKAPTCTEIGWDTYVTCSRCDYTTYAEKAALGHTEVVDARVEPTCTTVGKTEGKHCSVCNTVFSEQIEIPKIPHTYDDKYDTSCNVCGFVRDAECAHTELETIPGKDATCTAPGLTEGERCKKCDEIITAQTEIPALGHTEVIDTRVEPTCTESGKTEGKHCSACNTVIIAQTTIPAIGHKAGVSVRENEKLPTCTEGGSYDEVVYCTGCRTEISRVRKTVDALGHTEVIDASIAPTCTTTGKTEGKHCSVCNEVIAEQTEIPALGHDETNHEAKAPTCTEIGWDAYVTCSRCDYTTYAEKSALGHTEVIDARVEPTCTTVGKTEGKHCSVCNTVLTEQTELPVIAHTYDDKYDESCNVCGFIRDAECAHTDLETIPGKNATCTLPGLTEGKKCKKCGEIVTAQTEVPALGHDDINHEAKAPTCTEIGWAAYVTCSRCDYTTYAEKPATGHTEVTDASVASTCTTTGKTEGKHCLVCNTVLVAQTEVPALGHDEINHEAKAPTCTEIGWAAYVTCSRCDYTTYLEKAAVGHTEVTDAGVEPTCTATGKTEGKHCSVCNTVLVAQEDIEALGHDEINHEAEAPTCTEIGWDAYVTCSRCDYTTYAEKPAIGHTEVTDARVEATCTSMGKTEGKHCSVCNKVLIAVEDIQMLPHTPGETVKENEVLADCDTNGYYDSVVYCKKCTGEISRITTTFNAVGHSFLHGKCGKCGLERITEGLEYTAIDETSCYVSGIGNCTDTDIVIPETAFDGRKVVSIGADAFKNKTSIKSLLVPDSVTSIPEGAFSGCSNLESIVLPFVGGSIKTASEKYQYPFGYIFGTTKYTGSVATLQHYFGNSLSMSSYARTTYYVPEKLQSVKITGGNILYGAFYGCSKLVSIEIPNVTSIGRSSINGCSSLKSFVIPETVTDIGLYAFYNCKSLQSIRIPDLVASIGDYAFQGCNSLSKVEIGSGIVSIGKYGFADCLNIEYIYFDAVNMNNASANNYIFNNVGQSSEGVTLVIGSSVQRISNYLFSPSKSAKNSPKVVEVEFEADSACVEIGAYVFWLCSHLKEIELPDHLEKIGEYAFSNCIGITNIAIPSSVTDIGEYAFSECCLISATMGNGNTNIGNYAFYKCTGLADFVISLNTVRIGDYAFFESDLTNVVIGKNVVSIGECAFSECINLQSITVDEGNVSYKSLDNTLYTIDGKCLLQYAVAKNDVNFVLSDSVTSIADYAFSGCDGLISIALGNNITQIGAKAFKNCTSLTSVEVPNSVANIGDGAFNGCSNLESIVLPFVGGSVRTASEKYQYPLGYIFGTTQYTGSVATTQRYRGTSASTYQYNETTYYLPEKLQSVIITGGNILYGAFYQCANLVTIEIPNVTSIGRSAFNRCYSLKDFVIPETVTDIGVYAFLECKSLESIIIPDSVTVIGENAFENCSNLKEISIGKGVKSIGAYAFSNCTNVEYIYYAATNMNNSSKHNYIFYKLGQNGDGVKLVIGSNVQRIPAYLFAPSSSETSVTNIVNVEFESGSVCTEIASHAFWTCYFIEEITLPDSVLSIGAWSFRYCISLKSIIIPDSVTSIGEAAFYYCTSLTEAVIGNGVTSIGASAFAESGLTNVVIGKKVTSIGNDAFNKCTSLTNVYYTGTETEWNAITVGSSNTPLTNATKHYNYTPDN